MCYGTNKLISIASVMTSVREWSLAAFCYEEWDKNISVNISGGCMMQRPSYCLYAFRQSQLTLVGNMAKILHHGHDKMHQQRAESHKTHEKP